MIAEAAVAIWRKRVNDGSIPFSIRATYGPAIRSGRYWMLTLLHPFYFEEEVALTA